jgi:hypothetical protein
MAAVQVIATTRAGLPVSAFGLVMVVVISVALLVAGAILAANGLFGLILGT